MPQGVAFFDVYLRCLNFEALNFILLSSLFNNVANSVYILAMPILQMTQIPSF